MPYEIIRQDITKIKVDAIVDPTDYMYSGSGGADACIHSAAGPELRAACDALPLLAEGEVAVTDGFRLPCKYIIHTFGPIWQGGKYDEQSKLTECYENVLAAADERGCDTIAIPLISAGTFGYPKDKVLRIALDTIGAFLMSHDMTVYVLVYDKEAYAISQKLQNDISDYISRNYIEQRRPDSAPHMYDYLSPAEEADDWAMAAPAAKEKTAGPCQPGSAVSARIDHESGKDVSSPRRSCRKIAASERLDSSSLAADLETVLKHPAETFSDALLRLIDEKGMTDVQCYKKANIDKKLFSKIKSNANYQPSKPTVLAFSIALNLSLSETNKLLGKAGFAFSESSIFDLIIKYFISDEKYDINEINEVLYQYDQKCLGNVTA